MGVVKGGVSGAGSGGMGVVTGGVSGAGTEENHLKVGYLGTRNVEG